MVSASAKKVMVRLIDQGSWSAAFFAFNILASFRLSTSEFGALAIVTSVAFIVIAVVRAGSINARVVAGARVEISPEHALSLGAASRWTVAGCVLATCVLVAILVGDVDTTLLISLIALGAVLIMSDAPHQLLIFGSRYLWAAYLALAYFALGVTVFATGDAVSSESVIGLWALSAVVVFIAGASLARFSISGSPARLEVSSFSWRMAAEAFYVGVSGQLAILVLYLVSSSEASAGFRYSYALVFAPAFMVIQGLSPLYIKSLAEIRRGPDLARRALLWSLFVSTALGLSAVGALSVSYLYPDYDALVVARTFLVPVGLSVLSGQLLEGFTSASRFLLSPVALHRLRLWVVTVDISAQLVGVMLFDVKGLVIAIIVVAAAKIFACVALAMILHNEN